MKCDQINNHFIEYMEQSIPVDLQEQIASHLQECHACRILYENVKATYFIYDKSVVPEVNPFFCTVLEQKLESRYSSNAKVVIKLAWKLHPVAATILVIIGICMGILLGNGISGSGISVIKPNRSELLEAYASDYNLIPTNDENVAALLTNE